MGMVEAHTCVKCVGRWGGGGGNPVRVGICNISVFYHPAIYRSPSLIEVDE